MIQFTKNLSLTVGTYSNDADELRRALEHVPAGAKYDVSHIKGDRPWDSDQVTIKFSWGEEL